MAVINCRMHYPHQINIPKYCLTASSGGFEYGTTVVCFIYQFYVLFTNYQLNHKRFSTWINILYMGSPHISRNDPIHTAAPPPLSTHHNRFSTVPDGNLLQVKTIREPVICHFTNEQTGSCLNDHS